MRSLSDPSEPPPVLSPERAKVQDRPAPCRQVRESRPKKTGGEKPSWRGEPPLHGAGARARPGAPRPAPATRRGRPRRATAAAELGQEGRAQLWLCEAHSACPGAGSCVSKGAECQSSHPRSPTGEAVRVEHPATPAKPSRNSDVVCASERLLVCDSSGTRLPGYSIPD